MSIYVFMVFQISPEGFVAYVDHVTYNNAPDLRQWPYSLSHGFIPSPSGLSADISRPLCVCAVTSWQGHLLRVAQRSASAT